MIIKCSGQQDCRRSFGLLYEDLRRVVGVDKGLVAELAVSHVAVHAAVFGEHLHVALVFPHFLDATVQVVDEAIAAAVHEPELEVAVPGQQVLVGRSAAFEIGVPEEWKLHGLIVESSDGDVEGPEICGWFCADEDDAMRGEECLDKMMRYCALELLLAEVVDLHLELNVVTEEQEVLHGDGERNAGVIDWNVQGHPIISLLCEIIRIELAGQHTIHGILMLSFSSSFYMRLLQQLSYIIFIEIYLAFQMASFFSSLIASITGVKVVLFLVVLLAVAVWFILKEIKQKEELKLLLEKALQGKPISPTDIQKFQTQINQVRLKEDQKQEFPRYQAGNPIYKIVITGGPCGGKSTSLTKIQEDMTSKGFRVFSIPQIPTLVVQAGGMILMSKFSIEERIKFQSLLIRFQMYVEDYFTQLAMMSKSPSIIICDRGTCDPAAYVSKEEFQAILDEEGWTWTMIRDKRYDGVLHLVTAAIGAEEFYTRSNNTARSEGIQVARALDKKTLDAWTGHPHIIVCPNIKGETFDKKLGHAIRGVYKIVGIELKSNRYQKFIIKKPQFPSDSGLKIEQASNEQIILVSSDPKWVEDRIKRRGQNNNYTYQRKQRAAKNQEGDYTQQVRTPLSALQYVQLKEEKADKKFKPIQLERTHFIIGSTHFSIDTWQGLYGQEETYILRFANPDKAEPKSLVPEWLEVLEDVRESRKYELKEIARIK